MLIMMSLGLGLSLSVSLRMTESLSLRHHRVIVGVECRWMGVVRRSRRRSEDLEGCWMDDEAVS